MSGDAPGPKPLLGYRVISLAVNVPGPVAAADWVAWADAHDLPITAVPEPAAAPTRENEVKR